MLRVVPNKYIPRTDYVCDYDCFKHIRPDGIEVVFQRGMEVEMFGQVGYIYTSVYDNKNISAHVTFTGATFDTFAGNCEECQIVACNVVTEPV